MMSTVVITMIMINILVAITIIRTVLLITVYADSNSNNENRRI